MSSTGFTKFFIGIDNGISGTISIIGYGPNVGTVVHYVKTPTKSEQDYTKKDKNITRIDSVKMINLFSMIPKGVEIHALLERPMVNPKMFQATISAVRALEATVTILEALKIPFSYIDSKEWQKALLPIGCKGDALKSASLNIGERLYPGKLIKGHKDADGLLIGHYCMIKNK